MADPSIRRDLKELHSHIKRANLALDTIPEPYSCVASARKSLNAALTLSERLIQTGCGNDSALQFDALSGQVREMSKVRRQLRHGLKSATLEDCKACIAYSIEPLDRVAQLIASPAVLMGKLGGRKTAERGPEYFAEAAAMRKDRKGGRARKRSKAE
jgi:hypothetical protein